MQAELVAEPFPTVPIKVTKPATVGYALLQTLPERSMPGTDGK